VVAPVAVAECFDMNEDLFYASNRRDKSGLGTGRAKRPNEAHCYASGLPAYQSPQSFNV